MQEVNASIIHSGNPLVYIECLWKNIICLQDAYNNLLTLACFFFFGILQDADFHRFFSVCTQISFRVLPKIIKKRSVRFVLVDFGPCHNPRFISYVVCHEKSLLH